MNGIATYLEMGGRAAFVWPAYGISALVLIGLLALSLKAMRAAERELSTFERGREVRGRRDRRQ
jgi:heme exporter protein D